MKLHILSVGQRMPAWVCEAFAEYQKRMPREMPVSLIEIPNAKGANWPVSRIIDDESNRLLAALPKNSRLVLLDVTGVSWSTEQLASRMQDWRQEGQDMVFVVGGANGVSDLLRQQSSFRWSLSAATFPHPLVRVILVEQLYRAWTIISGHPYHRE